MHSLRQLQSGELVGIKRLSLRENLTRFPLEILSLADSLEVLDLSGNQLSELPSQLIELKKLKIIFASNNLFEHLPEVLGSCAELEMVGFKSNKIKQVAANSLPAKLRWLILTDNLIESLPVSIGERPRLQKLALAGNRITQLPLSMAQCTNLELIRISANQLTECPEHILNLPKLSWLAFAGNPFSRSTQEHSTVPQVASASFTLQEILGQGASGLIYRAEWLDKQHTMPTAIAVKVFKGEVTSDGYPQDELQACLRAGAHPNLVQALAQVEEDSYLALIMQLIPAHFRNLGLPPSLQSCTRDVFPEDFRLSIQQIAKIVRQMVAVFEHLHARQICHGDLYAHNTLYDDEANIIFGDFGAASTYHMLNETQQTKIKHIEQRALRCFIDDLLNVCTEQQRDSAEYQRLRSLYRS